MKKISAGKTVTAIVAHGSILVFAVMALEIAVMISPFAFFFYSVFGPIFKWLDQYAATAWLTDFFLPHMILPPTLLLKAIRILGSGLFLLGAITFIICALQVYLGKVLKWGVAKRGLYGLIRHPQYLGLALWAIGMSILWPRFIVLLSLSLMFVLYYYLAKDEERRMLSAFGQSYTQYMTSTGMFVPLPVEKSLLKIGQLLPRTWLRYVTIPLLIVIVVMGTGYVCREITLRSLSFESADNISIISILPEDNALSTSVVRGIKNGHEDGKMGFLSEDRDYLGYVMPADYIMQGMIANTGSEYHLYKQHNTIAMITDWVFNPFQHLRRPPSVHMAKMHNVDPSTARRHHCPMGIDDANLECATCPYRRVIIEEVRHKDFVHLRGPELLSLNTKRLPVAFLDINTSTGEIINIKQVEPATAWGEVPTPSI
jgi:protein-S-isoprenylcysteine O-methyltransferase Ste14